MTDLIDPAVERDWLPPLLREIEEVAGLEAALRICQRWGGSRLFVPRSPGPDHPIVREIGAEAAGRLCGHFAGEELTVPLGAGILRRLRNREIIARYRAGESAGSIARDMRMTERWVYAIVGREEEDRSQMSLF